MLGLGPEGERVRTEGMKATSKSKEGKKGHRGRSIGLGWGWIMPEGLCEELGARLNPADPALSVPLVPQAPI